MIARPSESSATGAPFSVSVRAAMAEKASASTVSATGCPGSDGKLGVSEIVSCGPTGSASTFSARPRCTCVLPSLCDSTTRCSPTWPGAGVQTNSPVTSSSVAPCGRPLAPKRSVSFRSASLPPTVKRSVSPSATRWLVKASDGARLTSSMVIVTVRRTSAPAGRPPRLR